MFGLTIYPFANPISLSRIYEDLSLERQKHMPQYSSKYTCHMLHAFWGWPVHGNNSISQFYLAEVAMTDSLSRIHEELSLKGQKHMSHTNECSWHLLHALRGWHVHDKYESLWLHSNLFKSYRVYLGFDFGRIVVFSSRFIHNLSISARFVGFSYAFWPLSHILAKNILDRL